MAITKHGDQSYTFGFDDPAAATIAAAIGIKPQTLSIATEPEFTAAATDEVGETAAFVVGGDKHNFTLNGYMVDEAKYKAAKSFEFDGKFFIIVNRKKDLANNDFQKAEFTGVSFTKVVAPTV